MDDDIVDVFDENLTEPPQLTPATDLFAVYDRQIGIGFERPGTRVTIKFRKTFDL